MAAIPFVGTIESDEEVEQFDREGESDDEEETPVKKRKKKRDKSLFSDSFQFADGEEFSENTWNIDTAMRSAKKKEDSRVQTSSLQEKITKRREQKKKSKRKKASSEDHEQETEPPNVPAAEADGDEANSDSSSEDEADDKVKQKKKFFEEPPPQMKCHSFTDMNLSRPLLKAVTELGFVHPTPIQAATIPVALMAKDICACAATGTGKTAAFMLPILERLLYRPHHTPVTRVLILSPTRELAIQTHSVSKAMTKFSNIQICLAAGGLDSKAQEVALRKGPDIVIATPGRLVDHLHNAHSFDLQSIEILVLDEADRMLDEHFKDQMDEIVRLSPRGRQTMLFSATMTDEVEELVNLSLNQPVRLFVDANTDVAYNLRQEFIRIRPNREDDRMAIVVALCCRTFTDHCLVFLQTKKLAHRLRINLGLMGLNVEELHGNLTQLQRLESLEKFKEAKVDILVATDLASRGLDISGVKTVINHSMPSTLKSYVHRVGRTARAGKSGRSVSLVGEPERKLLKEIVKQARTPVKSRVIPPEVIEKYNLKIDSLNKDVTDLLKQEYEEKMVRVSEMEVNKARNMIEHEQEIFSRPARVWFQNKTNQKRKAENGGSTAAPPIKKSKKDKKKEKYSKSPEEQSVRLEQEFFKREAKRSKRPKKQYVFPPDKPVGDTNNNKPAKAKSRGKGESMTSSKAFDKELTDTSKKALRQFRNSNTSFNGSKKTMNKKGGHFKSKKRYKRRK